MAGISVFSLGVFLVLAWFAFSFVFWKILRNMGTPEHRIFDLTFYSTIVALITSRLVFILLHPSLFSDTLLKTVAVWVEPGFSLYGGLIGALATATYLSRRYKIRVAYVLDAWAVAFPIALLIGEIGSFLDGTEVGKATTLPWGILSVGHVGVRHPVQVYEIIILVLLLVLVFFLNRKAKGDKWPFGLVGIWFFFWFSVTAFLIEFVKESSVYWLSLTPNQWILVAIFAESMGAMYVRGGGREKLRPFLRNFGGTIYAKIRRKPAA